MPTTVTRVPGTIHCTILRSTAKSKLRGSSPVGTSCSSTHQQPGPPSSPSSHCVDFNWQLNNQLTQPHRQFLSIKQIIIPMRNQNVPTISRLTKYPFPCQAEVWRNIYLHKYWEFLCTFDCEKNGELMIHGERERNHAKVDIDHQMVHQNKLARYRLQSVKMLWLSLPASQYSPFNGQVISQLLLRPLSKQDGIYSRTLYLRVFLELQSLLINIFTLIRDDDPRI